jgi:hypothetical protein
MQHPGIRSPFPERGRVVRVRPALRARFLVASLAVFEIGLLACSIDDRPLGADERPLGSAGASAEADASAAAAGAGAGGAGAGGTTAGGNAGSGGTSAAGSGGDANAGGTAGNDPGDDAGSGGSNAGSGGSSSLAGAGGTAADGAALGASCTLDADCAQAHCVPAGAGGALICCDAACDGICETCNESGLCQATATDDACSSVPCASLGVGCRTSTDITDNLCRGRGECKDTSDCTFDNLPDGTACSEVVSTFNVCQSGTCVEPPVVCGQQTCSVDVNDTCCFRGEELGEEAGYACDQHSVCGSSGIFAPIQFIDCDSPDDCRPGAVCCIDISVNARFANLTCKPVEECNIDDGSQMRFAQLCGSLSFADPGVCPSGRPCVGTGDDSILPGFSFCGPP